MVDVDGVLVCGRPSDGQPWAASIEADLGLTREQLQKEFFKPHWSKIVIGQGGLREHLEPVLARIAPRVSYEKFVSYWFENDARLNIALLEEIQRWRASGTKIYLATNQEHLRAAHLMAAVGLQHHCDGIFYSAALGCRKPDLAFFDKAAELSGFAPEQLVLIDDTAENLVAARKAGWNAVMWEQQSSLSSALDGIEKATSETP
jgi:putative hydrolase of the HAD superfamily